MRLEGAYVTNISCKCSFEENKKGQHVLGESKRFFTLQVCC